MTLKEMFDLASEADEYLEFGRVENKLNERPDLHAFLLLDKLCPNPGADMISYSEHDQFYLSIECEELEKVITQEQVIELYRCGVSYDSDSECLYMFS